jgi:hypothetical protein
MKDLNYPVWHMSRLAGILGVLKTWLTNSSLSIYFTYQRRILMLKDKLALFGASIFYVMACFALPILVVTLIAVAGVCS